VQQGRRIAFDYGDVRIGVALSDASGILATPYATLSAQAEDLAAQLSLTFEEINPIYIVLGLPKNLSGQGSAKIAAVQEFAGTLRQLTQAPIYFVDERLTTVSAARTLKESGKNTREARLEIDAMAAAAILESALNNERLQGVPARESYS
jgi:putative Holliday junction resolvase